MGYCACSEGILVAKDKNNTEKIIRLIEDSGCFSESYKALKNQDSKTITVLAYNDVRYDEDTLYELFSELTPLIEEAEIEWMGEDSTYWKHTYKEDDGWKEIPGEIVYNDAKAWKLTVDKSEEEER